MAVSVLLTILQLVLNTMQHEEQPALSNGQQVGVTACFFIQYFVLCPAAISIQFITKDSTYSDLSSRVYLPILYFLSIVEMVVGILLVAAIWCGFGWHSLEFWSDCLLFTLLLWSMLLEVSTHMDTN